MPSVELTWIALALVTAVVLIFAGAWIERARHVSASTARLTRGRRDESGADALLVAEGFRVVAREFVTHVTLRVNGAKRRCVVRIDRLVEQHGHRYPAEIKSGADAPDPSHPATRRQLLEYALAMNSPHVVLVDVTRRDVSVVTFPSLCPDDLDTLAA